jgi:nitrate reductase (cytochrome), electron transfer subunit
VIRRRSLTAFTATLGFAGAILAIALVGFVTGTHSRPTRAGYQNEFAPTIATAAAPSYREIPNRRWSVNAGMYDEQVPALALSLPVAGEPVAPPSAADRAAAIVERSRIRAYAGAPPTIPHAIDERGLPGCLACHGKGAVAAGRMAPMMSHAVLQNCVQCHVPGVAREGMKESMTVENVFVGMAPHPGQRAWTGAPPTMPHPSFMRERCNSCHGVGAWAGLRTPHLDRSNCQQCHAPSALLDQFSSAGGPPDLEVSK